MNITQQTEEEGMGWRVMESRTAYENSLLLLRELALEVPNGESCYDPSRERGPMVMIVPVTHQGEVVMLRQFRMPVDQWCLELPARMAEPGEDKPLDRIVAEELESDLGGYFDALEQIGSFYLDPAVSGESCYVFLVVGVCLRPAPPSAPGEEARIVRKPVAEVVQLVRNGGLRDGPAALAVLLCEPRLRELGFL